MAMSDPQFMTLASGFSATVERIFEVAITGMTPEQIDGLLGVLSGNLAGLMERHIGRAAMVERFVELGDYYRAQGAGEGALQ